MTWDTPGAQVGNGMRLQTALLELRIATTLLIWKKDRREDIQQSIWLGPAAAAAAADSAGSGINARFYYAERECHDQAWGINARFACTRIVLRNMERLVTRRALGKAWKISVTFRRSVNETILSDTKPVSVAARIKHEFIPSCACECRRDAAFTGLLLLWDLWLLVQNRDLGRFCGSVCVYLRRMGDLRESMQKKVSGRRAHTTGESLYGRHIWTFTMVTAVSARKTIVTTVSGLRTKHKGFFVILYLSEIFVQ